MSLRTSKTSSLAESAFFPLLEISIMVSPCAGQIPQAVWTISVIIPLNIPSSLLSFLLNVRYGDVAQKFV